MREKLISYLIEDIAPAVEKNHDPEGTILKFANEHNMASSLVETLGQLYNTAKTVAHLEKSANRGSDFPLLDVPKMMGKYLEVHPVKQAAIKGESAYDQFNCSDPDSLPSFFENIGVPVRLVKDESTETPVKSASVPAPTRADYRAEDDRAKEIEYISQARFEFTEDLRQHLTKFAFTIKQAGTDFSQFEEDAVGLHGDSVKPVMDHLARFCEYQFVQVKRASLDKKGDTNVVVTDEHGLFAQLEQIQMDMAKIAAADAELTKLAGPVAVSAPEVKEVDPAAVAAWQGGSGKTKPSSPSTGGGPPVKPTKAPAADAAKGKAKAESKAERPPYLKTLAGAGSAAVSPYEQIPAMKRKLEEFMGTGFNSDQQTVDRGYNDAKHLSVLQQLLTSDEVLAEADHDKVVNMFNTLRQTAPSLAADPNIAGVALRSMIQHDGISPFDVKGFLETENAKQKNVMNEKVLDAANYGGAPIPKPDKVR